MDFHNLFMLVFFFQAEDGIRDAQESRGLGDVYKRQSFIISCMSAINWMIFFEYTNTVSYTHLTLPTILTRVDLGGRRIIKKKKKKKISIHTTILQLKKKRNNMYNCN